MSANNYIYRNPRTHPSTHCHPIQAAMNHYFSNAFAFSQPSVETDCLHVGSGIQSFSPLIDASDDSFKSACSSMCSAASTVASALCSIEGSVSFPSSSETTFDLAKHLTQRLNEQQQESRNRRCDSERGWRRSTDRNAPSERRHLDSFGDTFQAAQYWQLDFSERSRISAPRPDQFLPLSMQHPALEEFSLGSGNPYAACDLSLAPQNQ